MIGSYPTPVQHLAELSTPSTALWVKRDDLTSEIYGGNKVRRLEYLLEQVRARRARRLLTVGAAGSHHVLACSIFGRLAGIEVGAVLTPQPRTEHAVNNLRVALGQGLQVFAAESTAAAPLVLARAWGRHDFFLAPGGSSVTGTLGYVDAIFELQEQVRRCELPMPDAIVVALGSGGTTAGILAGCVALGLTAQILAVRIVSPLLMGRTRVAWLALSAGRRRGLDVRPKQLRRLLEVHGGYLGRGYGRPTPQGEHAARRALASGLSLDSTYTAKAFAAALDVVESGRFRNVLYWHTLSSAPMSALLEQAPHHLPAACASLFIR